MDEGHHSGPSAPPGPDPFASNPFGDIPGGHDPFGPPPSVSGPAPSPHRPPAAGGEVNTLATLSVVFAFVFAPVGAVLGHLGLSQIARTGQRGRDRALIGVTLSYLFIIVTVVALTVWLATGTTSTPPTAATSTPATSNAPTTSTAPTTSGTPTSAAAPPTPITRNTIAGALLDGPELAQILGQDFEDAPKEPVKVGGLEALPNGLSSEAKATPHECVGATAITQQSIYQSAAVTDYATARYGTSDTGWVMVVGQAVVALPTPADAEALFAAFTQQWQRCDGRTVTTLAGTAPDGSHYVSTVTNVRVLDSVLAATIETDHSTGGWARPEARAIGVRGRFLVEVDVAFNGGGPTRGSTSNPETGGIDVARALMDKVG